MDRITLKGKAADDLMRSALNTSEPPVAGASAGSALRDNYEKERTNYWSEPCDTCKHRHQRPDNPTCQQCIHYAR